MNKKTICFIVLIFVLLALVACNRRQQNQNRQEISQIQQEIGQEIEQVQEQVPIQYNSEDDFRWQREGDGIIITGYIGSNMNVNIPPQIQGLPVTGIGNNAFRDGDWEGEHPSAVWISKYQLTSVTIPYGVTKIGDGAFRDNQLTNIIIPDSVIEIGGLAFAGNQLISATLPNGITYIRWEAFAGNRLTNITIPNSVIQIDEWAFAGNRLTNITIPDNITKIEGGAFSGNDLTTVIIGKNVTLWFDVRAIDYTGGFGSEFAEFYKSQGSRAGTYTYSNGQWNVQLR
ncbi:MAG: leucine-rich repeat domain-containing protein [Treponema sp.]|jgi:hypothetical protein|nr:leucine-rich repeat domain-containing protein [Treponema sp.]